MQVVIAGGRHGVLTSDDHVWLDTLKEVLPITAVVTGGAAGIDTAAHRWAVSRGIPTHIERAQWDKHGRAAGPIRNKRMLQQIASSGENHALITFPGGQGTLNIIHTAKVLGIRHIERAVS